MKNTTIKAKLIALNIISISIISIVLIVFSIYSIEETSGKNIESFTKKVYSSTKAELKSNITIASKTIESFYTRSLKENVKKEVQEKLITQSQMLSNIINTYYEDNMDNPYIEEELLKIIKNSTYNDSDYFWVNDLDATMLMHPLKPALNGKDLTDIKDPNGKKVFVEAIKIVKEKESGFLDYQWNQKGFDTPQDKISYVFLFKPFNWVIGTGVYLGDVSKELQEDALNVLKNMRFGKDNKNYFWVNTSHPKMVMHPIKPKLDGTDISNVKDPNGKAVFVEMAKSVKNEKAEGFVDYQWQKEGFDKPQNKISFVKHFKQWDWIIGAGVYLDDIEAEVNNMKLQAEEQIHSTILTFIITALVITTIITLLIMFSINLYVVKPLDRLKSGFKNLLTTHDIKTRLEVASNDEVGQTSIMFNEYMDYIEQGIKEDEVVINDVKRVVELVKEGTLYKKVEKSTKNKLINDLKDMFNDMLDETAAKVCGDVTKIERALIKFQELDFTHRVANPTGKTSQGLNSLSEIISEMLFENKKNGLTLEHSANYLLKNVETLNVSSNQAATSLEETAAALEEMTGNISSNTQNVVQMASYANDLTSSVKEGRVLASKTTSAMDEINSQVKEINEAISVIDQIAFQTNILSLNAAVEAATAGEAGKGFAVVAQEVRNLASRAAEAAKEIKELVESASGKADEGKDISDSMINGYEKLSTNIDSTLGLIKDVESASKEQYEAIEQINNAISELDQQTQENANVASQTSTIATHTLNIANRIVDNANAKEFDGKDEVEAEEMTIN